MNILKIDYKSAPFNLSVRQQQQCGAECLAYISSHNIQTTTCGTRIEADNVIPQKGVCKMYERIDDCMIEIHGQIANQPVIATANKQLLQRQKLFDFCAKKTAVFNDQQEMMFEYSECKHVKFIIQQDDIIIAK